MLKGVSCAMRAVWQLRRGAAHRNSPTSVAGFANRGAGKTVRRLMRPGLKTSATPLHETAKAILNHQPAIAHEQRHRKIAAWIDKQQSSLRKNPATSTVRPDTFPNT